MNNKDMPAYPVIMLRLDVEQQNILLLALHAAHGELYSNDARKDVRDMIETIKEARSAALAELERRDG